MGNICFTVEKVEFTGWKVWLSVSVKGEYDERVRNPKIAVTFDSGTQTRRVPVLVNSYTQRGDTFRVDAHYGYDVRHLFYNEPLSEKITLYFDVMYGEDYYEHIPYVLGEMAKFQEEAEEDDDEDDEDKDDVKGDYYDIVYDQEESQIEFLAKYKLEKATSAAKVKRAIQSLVRGLWKYVRLVVALCLLPLYFVDGILAKLGCSEKNGKIHSQNIIIYLIKHARWRVTAFCKVNIGILPMKLRLMSWVNGIWSWFPIKHNQIVFLSNRRNDLSGNFEFVYDLLKDDQNLDIRFILDNHDVRHMKFKNMLRLAKYFATSRVILVDDYMELLFKMPRREGTTLIQLWHACGAFKTFGCSRLGKKGGQTLKSPNHRNYDYATVSSKEIAKFYAEGFGLSMEKVVATGVPRTDIFFDQKYKEKVTAEFYEAYPKLKEKKIILFAPTFRGNGKNSGYYPVELFDVNRLYEELGQEYAIIIKHHPFVRNRNEINPKYKDYIIDLSQESELNDLLFVTDLLITDYSSVVFEASLLKIPMLFYVFDLEQYIASRGFYYEYETFVPGKIVYKFPDVAKAIQENDLEQDKIEGFRDRFFDGKDGKSSQRTVDLIYENLN